MPTVIFGPGFCPTPCQGMTAMVTYTPVWVVRIVSLWFAIGLAESCYDGAQLVALRTGTDWGLVATESPG